MNTILLTIALSIFILGAVITNKNVITRSHQVDAPKAVVSEEVLSDTDDDKDSDKSDKEGSGDFEGSWERSPSPTVKPFPTLITIAPSKPSTQDAGDLIAKFIYPGSTITGRTSSTLNSESSDDPRKISDWYKAKIRDMNFTATSSVFTQANEKYLIKLSGASGSLNIAIEVSKEGNESAKIKVSID